MDMKKIVTVLIAIAALFGAMGPQKAKAAGGDMAVGLNGGFATYNDGGYMSLYYQYEFATHFRLAPEIGYVFRNDGCSAFTMNVDMQFPFRLHRVVAVYPLVGLTFNNWMWHDGNAARVGGNFGAGIDFYLTNYLKLNIQGKYSVMNDTSGGFFGVCIGYEF